MARCSNTPKQRQPLYTSGFFSPSLWLGDGEIQHPQGKYACRTAFGVRLLAATMIGEILTIKAGYFMNNNVFVVNTSVSTAVIKNALQDRLFQIKALVECLRLAATTHELNSSLVHDAIWAIDNDLEQAMQLQEAIGEG
jgi:hypothetical protein